jgi:hypothetical protein
MKTKTEKLSEARQKLLHNNKGMKKDFDGFYGKLVYNKEGNAGIIMRPIASDETFMVTRYNHALLSPSKKWCIIDVCAATIEEACPICERDSKPKVNYVTNIVVVGDPLRPENVGKVMLINLPATAATMLTDADFDAWDTSANGYNFMLKASRAGKTFPSYDASGFEKNPSALGTPEEIGAYVAACTPLNSILQPSYSYAETARRYEQWLRFR